ncbi:hypothetical protein Sputw3181_2841 [Shewanella sp. W3-18-1]|nr:hypothetical protein Sputw3181_2841 [Shewanella sp. W3-18-1]
MIYIIVSVAVSLLTTFIVQYVSWKGRGLATKEDISGITTKIEDVKLNYSEKLEDYKNRLWELQYEKGRLYEEFKIKHEILEKVIVRLNKFASDAIHHRIYAHHRNIYLALYKQNNSELDNKQYREFQIKAEKSYLDFGEQSYELTALASTIKVYIDDSLGGSLLILKGKIKNSVNPRKNEDDYIQFVRSELDTKSRDSVLATTEDAFFQDSINPDEIAHYLYQLQERIKDDCRKTTNK